MPVDLTNLITKVAKLIAVNNAAGDAQLAIKAGDIANIAAAVTDAEVTDNLQPVVDSIMAQIDAEVARLGG